MAKVTKSSLSEEDRLEAAECILPGISIFLEKLLARERISNELDSIRQCYVEILRCRNSTELAVSVKKKVEALDLKLDSNTKLGKFGRIREKRLINIRQFNLKHNQRKQELKNKISLMNDNSQLETYINKKNHQLSTTRSRQCAREDAGQMNIMMTTDDERHGMTATDDERRLSAASENFVELSKSQVDLTSKNLSKLGDTSLNQGHLYHKENEVIRQRWLLLDANVLRCYKRQNGAMLFELDFTEGGYSAMQGRIGKMFAIRLSGSKTVTSHLFASSKVETIASWIMSFSRAGVRLQDDLLREISPTEQNNNKVNSSYKERKLSDKDDFSTNLLDAIEFFDRRQNGCILPKRSSCSFKELEVLRKLKLSLTAKKNESRLDRRKTWSAGTFPVSPVAMFDTFHKINASPDGYIFDPQKEKDDIVKELASKSLQEIVTSNDTSFDATLTKNQGKESAKLNHEEELYDDPFHTKSLPEGLNKHEESDSMPIINLPHKSITAQSVPDLHAPPEQDAINPSTAESQLKSSLSLTKTMSLKASMMKNAIVSGWKRKGRRNSGITALDPEHTEIQGCLFRKKGPYWKLRWCAVSADVFYIFRDSQYSQEVLRCNLRKSYLVSTPQLGATRAHNFKLVVRNGTELSLAAENHIEFERWLAVLKKETSKFYLPLANDTVGDSSATEDTPPEKRNSNYCETTDKDSSDEHSTTSSLSGIVKQRGIQEKGHVYFFVKQETWEYCWMEVSYGILSIYTNESKTKALQRDHVPLCDIRHDTTNVKRPNSFVLKKPGRHPIYFAVDSDQDFFKWKKCFESWGKSSNYGPKNEFNEGLNGYKGVKRDDVVQPTVPGYLHIPTCETPITSDSDGAYEGNRDKGSELTERPNVGLTMVDGMTRSTPIPNRHDPSSVVTSGNDVGDLKKTTTKCSFLHYKTSTGLWVKFWCVLESATIHCFDSQEDVTSNFKVQINGCEVQRTTCKTKNYTFDIFDRRNDKHSEFAAESSYVMYGWMRVLKIAAGNTLKKIVKSDDTPQSKELQKGEEIGGKKTPDPSIDDVAESNVINRNVTSSSSAVSYSSASAATSPRRKSKVISLDEVLQLLHEKQLEQQLMTKQLTSKERARLKWQHSMRVVLRKTRNMRAHNTENFKSSNSIHLHSGRTGSLLELNEKSMKVKHREISAKYDNILEDERLKMLRRETLLKKRRNSLILRQDMLQKTLYKGQENGRGTIRKRQSKSDLKELSKESNEETARQLADINTELDSIKWEMIKSKEEQLRISEDLNEQKRKEIQEMRLGPELRPQKARTIQPGTKSLHRRQISDSNIGDTYRKLSMTERPSKIPLSQTFSTPISGLTSKTKSQNSLESLPRTPPHEGNKLSKKAKTKSRSSQETLSLALSQIEDFEAFAQDSFKNADVGC